MIVEPVETLMTRILRQYNNKPEGWNVLTDSKGNVLVLGPRTGYRLKLISLNPVEYTGVGMKINRLNEVRKALSSEPSYGFRPLAKDVIGELLNNKSQSRQNAIIYELLKKNPVSTREIERRKPRAILGGPIISHPDLNIISSNQRKLEAKLSLEADKLFKRKYPGRAAIYR
jgi:hypothetical protein